MKFPTEGKMGAPIFCNSFQFDNLLWDFLTHWPNAAFKEQVAASLYMDLSGDESLSNISDEVLEETKIDGKNYCVPISYNTVGIYYNVDMFEENGWEVPKTYEELISLCEQIKTDGIIPIGLSNKMPGSVFQYASSLFYQMESYDKFIEDTSQDKLNLDAYGEELKTVGERILELNTYAQPDSMGAEDPQVVADFANGKVAMFISGSWQIPQITAANADMNFEMFTFPAQKEGEEIAGVFAGDFSLAVSATAEHPEEIKKFLKYMSSTEAAEQFAETDGSASCVKGVEYVAPQLQKQYEVIKQGRIASYPNEKWTGGTYYTEVGTNIQEMLVSKDVDLWVQSFSDIFKK